MRATLYAVVLSHPSHAVRLMLEHAGVEHRVVNILPGLWPLRVRLAGFKAGTVPALKLDGRRIQGSRDISRELDALVPDAGLLGGDSEVAEAERWGEQVFQPVPRRIYRWSTLRSAEVRRWIAREVAGMPAPGLMAALNAPVARRFARMSNATDEAVRADLQALPSMLDHVEELIESGVIGKRDAPNAADFQILTTVRSLGTFSDLRPAVEGRRAWELALALQPEAYEPVPPALPAEWLALR